MLIPHMSTLPEHKSSRTVTEEKTLQIHEKGIISISIILVQQITYLLNYNT